MSKIPRPLLTILLTLAVAALAVCAAVSPAVAVSAQAPSSVSGNPGTSINVSPTHLAPVIALGDETREKITLVNTSTRDLRVRGHLGYGAPSGEGGPQLTLEPDQVILKPGETATVALHITVPAEAVIGDRQDTARFDVSPAAGGNLSVVGQVAVVVATKVIRPVEDAYWSVPLLIDSTQPAALTIGGRNAGSFPAQLAAKVDLVGMFGQEETLHVVSESTAVGKNAEMQAIWDNQPFIGAGRATLSLSSGVGAPVEKTAYFIVLPWKVTSIALAILFAGFAGATLTPLFAKVFGVNWRKGGNGE